MKRTIIDITLHFLCSVIFSLWIYLKTENPTYAAIAIGGGIFLDLDHLVDHFLFFKKKFNLKDFLRSLYIESGKVYLFAHSWEINFIILLLSLSLKSFGLFILFLSFSLHLVIDSTQRRNPFFYFLIYRFSKQFDVGLLMPECKEKIFLKE